MNNLVIKEEDIRISYHASGYCVGYLWGGGRGSYEATTYHANTLEEVDALIEKGIKDGSIDSGMGYESVTGALMFIKKKKTLVIGEDMFNAFDYSIKEYGDITEDEVQQIYLS